MIRLVVSDVDGTLVTPEKRVSPATVEAAHRLRAAGVHLAVVSSRPPRGLAFLGMELGAALPMGGFNGGSILAPDGSVVEERTVPETAVVASIELFRRRGVQTWLFAGNEWVVEDAEAAYVAREQRTVRFEPVVTADFTPYLAHCGKVVGVSGDFDLLADCEAELRGQLGGAANAARSQRYYLDVTNAAADKGTATAAIARYYGVELSEVCAIGDEANDVPMFRAAGHSVAMGNAPPAVAAQAGFHTAANSEDGWAAAIDRFVLPHAS